MDNVLISAHNCSSLRQSTIPKMFLQPSPVDHLNNSLKFVNQSSRKVAIPLTCRIDTLDELEYFRYGGILQHVLRQLAA